MMPVYDALTVYQPWALLLALGFKEYETRDWAVPRHLIGRHLYIHAGRQYTAEEAFYTADFILRFPETKIYLEPAPVLGAILAVCQVMACHRTEVIRHRLSDRERAFGNYQPGRFAWQLKVIKRPAAPIPARGGRGIWKWEYAKKEHSI